MGALRVRVPTLSCRGEHCSLGNRGVPNGPHVWIDLTVFRDDVQVIVSQETFRMWGQSGAPHGRNLTLIPLRSLMLRNVIDRLNQGVGGQPRAPNKETKWDCGAVLVVQEYQ